MWRYVTGRDLLLCYRFFYTLRISWETETWILHSRLVEDGTIERNRQQRLQSAKTTSCTVSSRKWISHPWSSRWEGTFGRIFIADGGTVNLSCDANLLRPWGRYRRSRSEMYPTGTRRWTLRHSAVILLYYNNDAKNKTFRSTRFGSWLIAFWKLCNTVKSLVLEL